jgi:hypothetical protein
VVIPAVFRWRNTPGLDRRERLAVEEHQAQRVYFKIVDIDWGEGYGAYPVSKVKVPHEWRVRDGQVAPWTDRVELVPCIHISNATFEKIDDAASLLLAKNLLRKLRQESPPTIHGVLLDCDWNATTRDRFFILAGTLNDSLDIPVTAMLRLHQFADPSGTGVPPVDRCMLVPFNSGTAPDGVGNGSHFDEASAERYFRKSGSYPLPLDLALPAIGWGVHFRDEVAQGFLDEARLDEALMLGLLSGERNAVMTVTREDPERRPELRLGDEVHVERISPELIARIVDLASTAVNTDTMAVAFFEVGSPSFQRLDSASVQQMWRRFGTVRTRSRLR